MENYMHEKSIELLNKAIAENRILVTLDENFGDWVVLPLSEHPGVIRLKINLTVGIAILNASNKIDIKTILSYSLELDRNVLSRSVVV